MLLQPLMADLHITCRHRKIFGNGLPFDMRGSNMSGAKRKSRSVAAVSVRRASSRSVKKVVTDFPLPLYQETQRAARELSMNRSHFIRSAVETFLRNREKEKLEKAIAESFLANADLDRQLVDEFKYPDSDEAPNL
jgi:hypothetical protein